MGCPPGAPPPLGLSSGPPDPQIWCTPRSDGTFGVDAEWETVLFIEQPSWANLVLLKGTIGEQSTHSYALHLLPWSVLGIGADSLYWFVHGHLPNGSNGSWLDWRYIKEIALCVLNYWIYIYSGLFLCMMFSLCLQCFLVMCESRPTFSPVLGAIGRYPTGPPWDEQLYRRQTNQGDEVLVPKDHPLGSSEGKTSITLWRFILRQDGQALL